MDERAELRDIIAADAILRGDFTLASGKKSDYYLDCKKVTLRNPHALALAARQIFDKIRDIEREKGIRIDAIGGLTSGADPLLIAVSQAALRQGRTLPAFFVRDEQKSHGTKRVIEGEVPAGQRVIILDDVMTTGMSVLKAVRSTAEAGGTIVAVLVLVDREEPDRDAELKKYDWRPLFTVSELLND